jgi:hypothetical protein
VHLRTPNALSAADTLASFEPGYVERLQRQLALELATDIAATPITQTTRLPGFLNQKHSEPTSCESSTGTPSADSAQTISLHCGPIRLVQLFERTRLGPPEHR